MISENVIFTALVTISLFLIGRILDKFSILEKRVSKNELDILENRKEIQQVKKEIGY